jgi:hypothetical protein
MSGTIEHSGLNEITIRFRNASRALHDRLLGMMQTEMETLEGFARARMGELFRNPGRMQAALSHGVADSGGTIDGFVSADGLPYLAIHEFGGRTAPHDIFPVNAKMLRFLGNPSTGFRSGGEAGTDVVFARVVHHPGSQMPERSYLRYALAQRRAAIQAAFLAEAAAVARGEGRDAAV